MRRFQASRSSTPRNIVIFITNRCQLRCGACFYRRELNDSVPLLTLDEIRRLAGSLKHAPRIVLTGGEPFLREDIDEICRILNKYAGVKNISINTNGFMPDSIVDSVGRILRGSRLDALKLQLSVDGLKAGHDTFRGAEGSFAQAVATLKALKAIQRTHRNFFIEIASLVNRTLLNDIRDFIEYFQEFEVPMKFSVIRSSDNGTWGLPQDEVSGLAAGADPAYPDIDELLRFQTVVRELNNACRYKFWTEFQQLKFEHTLRALKDRQRALPCYAGIVDAVIYHNGEVAFCENTLPVGDLRDSAFDLRALWSSARARLLRGKIKNCVCTHGCNILTSMAYDDETLLRAW
ncbi:MAG: radical SAM protein [Candidatus Omnitrophica bacterium]|nr:radical SAM protein [Candidatus Omnitrophota bacterium]